MERDFLWPRGQTGAVSVTFDDGMRSQLEIAVPMLQAFELRATFYVHIGIGVDPEKRLQPWKAVAAAGHEIGNHSVTHPCSINLPFIQEQGRHGNEAMTLDEMEWEITEANRMIGQQIPQQAGRSFAYPCYQRAG